MDQLEFFAGYFKNCNFLIFLIPTIIQIKARSGGQREILPLKNPKSIKFNYMRFLEHLCNNKVQTYT